MFTRMNPDPTLVVGHTVDGRSTDAQRQHDRSVLAVDDEQMALGAASSQSAKGMECQGDALVARLNGPD